MFKALRRSVSLALILGALAACTSGPAPVPPASSDAASAASSPTPPSLASARARWVAAAWSELPGWEADRPSELWPALLRGCARPASAWVALCSEALALRERGDASLRAWLQTRLQAYRVESADGSAEGLITGYFEPLIDASREARGSYRVPLYAPPADLASRKPYWTRQQIDTLPAAKAALRGRELAYVADPLDALVLHIQGSGRLRLLQADGSAQLVRAAFAAHNEQPYKSVGRWLVEQGELKLDQASWPAIKAWARLNPKRLNELLWSNPRVVFFREEPLAQPELGPRGAQGVALTPARSIAVDPHSIPYGAPVWIDTTEPLSSAPLRRLVMAQDTGGAITGAVRADYFWGWGEAAEQQAGRMKQALRLWVLWPRGLTPPKLGG